MWCVSYLLSLTPQGLLSLGVKATVPEAPRLYDTWFTSLIVRGYDKFMSCLCETHLLSVCLGELYTLYTILWLFFLLDALSCKKYFSTSSVSWWLIVPAHWKSFNSFFFLMREELNCQRPLNLPEPIRAKSRAVVVFRDLNPPIRWIGYLTNSAKKRWVNLFVFSLSAPSSNTPSGLLSQQLPECNLISTSYAGTSMTVLVQWLNSPKINTQISKHWWSKRVCFLLFCVFSLDRFVFAPLCLCLSDNATRTQPCSPHFPLHFAQITMRLC